VNTEWLKEGMHAVRVLCSSSCVAVLQAASFLASDPTANPICLSSGSSTEEDLDFGRTFVCLFAP